VPAQNIISAPANSRSTPISAASLGIPTHRLNIVPTLAGGSFGSKIFIHRVMVIAATLARASGRPVKYIEDRIDNITACGAYGCDRIYDVELAVKEGLMTGLKCRVIDDYGAYFQFGVGHHGNALSQITGPYRLRSVRLDLTAMPTNECQQGAYRGFGSDVGNFVLEQMVDTAIAELNDDPIERARPDDGRCRKYCRLGSNTETDRANKLRCRSVAEPRMLARAPRSVHRRR
jgi:CO/xanthine dehydrogenase Mo-binding subunit